MKIREIIPAIALVVLCGITPAVVFAAGRDTPRETIAPAFKVPIANVPGKTMTAFVVEYPPGGKTPPHRHDSA
ncbi:MAG TPA: hypothetical protein VJ728_02480, partial [Candidatus Binataceae bacterium]|nr:hypothetical protein [Candidatus Binataceae bacterium]